MAKKKHENPAAPVEANPAAPVEEFPPCARPRLLAAETLTVGGVRLEAGAPTVVSRALYERVADDDPRIRKLPATVEGSPSAPTPSATSTPSTPSEDA